MTERPSTSTGAGAGRRAAATPAASRDAGARRLDGLVSTVARVMVLSGASAAVYAGCLAAVAGLQAEADDAAIRVAAPGVASIEQLRAANDRLEAAIVDAGSEAGDVAGGYAAAADLVAAYEARLQALAALVTDVADDAAALPDRVALPPVRIRGTTAPAPRSRATTGASGG